MFWRCLVRADIVVKHGGEFVKMMSASGCTSVGMGIESGSDKILSIVNKKETVKTTKLAIKMIKDKGIKVKGFFILGLPGESQETLDETRMFLDEMELDDVDIKIYQPYRGAPIHDNKDAYDIQWDEPKDLGNTFYKGRAGEYYGNIRTSSLTTAQIYQQWVEMENKYKWRLSA
jgi:radical SAM superfamily enzyme YgiQ (UPF0313 family)